ncbi:MAG: HAMP domain-containing histidine kinase [Candidatus Omnitrophica bacterium]|nr:HAMP domain-containing histidine kinase [Candidatus Omnitrophota bacterium]
MIPHWSVKFRLTLGYTFVLTVFLSVFAYLMHTELQRTLYQDADNTLLNEAQKVEISVKNYLDEIFSRIDRPTQGFLWQFSVFIERELAHNLNRLIKDWDKKSDYLGHSTLMIQIMGLDHQTIVSNLARWEGGIIFPNYERDSSFMEGGESLQTIHFQGKPIRLYYRLVSYQEKPIFIIQCGVPLGEVKKALSRLRMIIFVLIPIVVIAAYVAGWFLAKRSFRPVNLMIQEAEQITAAYLKGRLPRTHTHDEVDRLAATLNEMIDRIESSTRAVQDFSSDISHELKTPLAIIRGEIDLALRRTRSVEELTRTLRVIEGEVNELIRLVDDLLLLVRSDAQQLRFDKKPTSLKNLLGQVIDRFRDRANSKKISLAMTTDRDVEVLGDDVYLKRLFSNLVDNAIKFTPEEGRVWIELREEQESAAVDVVDNGIGIDVELQHKLFSRFFRTDQARSQEGSGLGLNIVKAICEGHGGSLTVHSKPGEGTRVTVLLPLFRGGVSGSI